MTAFRQALIVLAIGFLILLGLTEYQGQVIAQQRTTIRQMMHNPACMVDPQPKPVLENF